MNKNDIKIVFFGTSEFAEVILNKILKAKSYKLKAIITQPDQPVGRKKILTPPPVKTLAEKYNIPILQPNEFNHKFFNKVKKFNANLFITAAYGKIIPQSILDIPKYGALNIHPSLLPKYRGPSPIQYALLNGDQETGVTIMKMDDKMDHGPIISYQESVISNQDNYKTLSQKLVQLAADLLMETLEKGIIKDSHKFALKFACQPQDESKTTYTQIITKQDGKITTDKAAQEIYNMWRAYYIWPGIYFESRIMNHELRIKLLDIELTDLENKTNNPLELFVQDKNLYLTCAQNTILKINKLQPQDKKVMDAQSFINGYLK